MAKDDEEKSVNPPHNRIRHEDKDAEKSRLYWHHKRADTLETYYEMYPMDRPQYRGPRPKGRGGR